MYGYDDASMSGFGGGENGFGNFGGGYGYFDASGNPDPWGVAPLSPFLSTGSGGGGVALPGLGGINIQIPGLGGGGSSVPDTSEQLTALVNAAERELQWNLGEWQAQGIGAQQAIERAWSILNTLIPRLYRYGPEGINAAAERDRRIDPSRLRWDWIAYYIDPINGGPVQPEPLPPGSSFLPTNPGTGGTAPLYPGQLAIQNSNDVLLWGAAIVLMLLLLTNRKG